MKIQWQKTIRINAPVEQVYAYLADFTRHGEWAQTIAEIRQTRPGDKQGVGAVYRTYERQAMQANRSPGEQLRRGMKAVSVCEVKELIPNQRIVWHAYMTPSVGMYADLRFEFAAAPDGGTLLTQHIFMYAPALMGLMFRLMFGRELYQKSYAQWEAGLNNIQLLVEQKRVVKSNAAAPHSQLAY